MTTNKTGPLMHRRYCSDRVPKFRFQPDILLSKESKKFLKALAKCYAAQRKFRRANPHYPTIFYSEVIFFSDEAEEFFKKELLKLEQPK